MARGRSTASSPDEMSRLLVTIRGGLSQTEAARRTGAHFAAPLTQARVSRAEAGRNPLSPDEAAAFAAGCEATAEQRRRLIQLARDFEAEHVTDQPTLARKPHLLQQRIGRLERESTLIRGWQPEVVIGTVQTPAWTAAAFSGPGPAWLSRRPNVQLGIVPLGGEKPIPMPSAFHIFGRQTAVVGTPSGRLSLLHRPRSSSTRPRSLSSTRWPFTTTLPARCWLGSRPRTGLRARRGRDEGRAFSGSQLSSLQGFTTPR